VSTTEDSPILALPPARPLQLARRSKRARPAASAAAEAALLSPNLVSVVIEKDAQLPEMPRRRARPA
jgi:hypothetical protein